MAVKMERENYEVSISFCSGFASPNGTDGTERQRHFLIRSRGQPYNSGPESSWENP